MISQNHVWCILLVFCLVLYFKVQYTECTYFLQETHMCIHPALVLFEQSIFSVCVFGANPRKSSVNLTFLPFSKDNLYILRYYINILYLWLTVSHKSSNLQGISSFASAAMFPDQQNTLKVYCDSGFIFHSVYLIYRDRNMVYIYIYIYIYIPYSCPCKWDIHYEK